MLVTADGEPVRASAPDGTAVVPVYTSSRHLHRTGPLGFEQVPIADVLGRIPERHSLCLNSSAAVSMVLAMDGLEAALAEAEGTDGTEPAAAPRPR